MEKTPLQLIWKFSVVNSSRNSKILSILLKELKPPYPDILKKMNLMWFSSLKCAFHQDCSPSKEDIKPPTEEATREKTFKYCASLAQKTNLYSMCGYPNSILALKPRKNRFIIQLMWLIVKGNLVLSYKKHYLYETGH